HVVGYLIGHVGQAVVGRGGDPVRHVADLDGARRRVGLRIKQVQFARPLSDDHSQFAVRSEQRMMGRRTSRNLRHDLIGGTVQNQNGSTAASVKKTSLPSGLTFSARGVWSSETEPVSAPLGMLMMARACEPAFWLAA